MKNLIIIYALTTILNPAFSNTNNNQFDLTKLFSLDPIEMAINTAHLIGTEKERIALLHESAEYLRNGSWIDAGQSLDAYFKISDANAFGYKSAARMLIEAKINNGNYLSALKEIAVLQELLNDDPFLIQDLKWSKALCYLHINEEKAKSIFKNIAKEDGNVYNQEAQGLLALMD